MVNLGLITAKIDRLNNTIDFNPSKDPQKLLNDWSERVQKVLVMIDDVCRLIEKDKMLQDAKEKRIKLELMLDS